MRLTFAENDRQFCCNHWNVVLLATLSFAISIPGCNNTCFTFISSPPNGTIGITVNDPKPTCRLTTVNGAVRVQLISEPTCSSCSGSGQVQHIFLGIQGIEVRASPSAEDDSTDWRELLPVEFVKEPLQVDLVRGPADHSAHKTLGDIMAIPPGIYDQVRLHFAPNSPATDDRLPGKNPCASAGLNCVVMVDGRIQPLLFAESPPQLRITSDKIESGSLLIPPDIETDLILELNLTWVWFLSADAGLRLLPALAGSAKVDRIAFDRLRAPGMESIP
jgi:hypothetical protein